MKITGSMHRLSEGLGSVRVEAVYDTDLEDVWSACTSPSRLSRWVADVSGDLRVGGAFSARFTSGWEGTGVVEVCEPPSLLVVSTLEAGAASSCRISASLSSVDGGTLLVVSESGLALSGLPAYGAGWQVHLEDLGSVLSGSARCDMRERWSSLIESYRAMEVG